MNRKYLKLFLSMIVASFIISACKEDSGVPYTYSSTIDLKGSTLADDNYKATLLYSTDNGVTFVPYPSLSVGQKYKVLVNNTASHEDLTDDIYSFDWSASTPKPNGDATVGSPEFTLGGSNDIRVVVLNKHCAYVATSWVGDWSGYENGSCCGGTDALTIAQDSADPNKFIMSNFWGDGAAVKVSFSLNPSTNFFDQDITMPEQTTSEGGVAVGEGTYDQCAGTITIDTSYKIGGKTYTWVYELSR